MTSLFIELGPKSYHTLVFILDMFVKIEPSKGKPQHKIVTSIIKCNLNLKLTK